MRKVAALRLFFCSALLMVANSVANSSNILEIPITTAGASLYHVRLAVSDSHVVVVVPSASSSGSGAEISIHPFELLQDGALQALASRKLNGEWRVSIALVGSRLFLGLPRADTPGRRSSVEITSGGTAAWSRGQVVVTAGVVREFDLAADGAVDAGMIQSPEAKTFQHFGSRVFASADYVAALAADLIGTPRMYVFARSSPANTALTLERSGVLSWPSLAFTPEGVVAGEQTANGTMLGFYSLSAGKVERIGEIPDPDAGSGFSFGSDIEIVGDHMLAVSLGPGANNDGERVKPAVDFFSRSSPGTWVWGKRLRAGSQFTNYGTMKTATLSSDRAYTLTDTGMDEWSEAADKWTLMRRLNAAEIAPGVQVISIAAHSRTLALLLQSMADGTSAPKLFVTTYPIK